MTDSEVAAKIAEIREDAESRVADWVEAFDSFSPRDAKRDYQKLVKQLSEASTLAASRAQEIARLKVSARELLLAAQAKLADCHDCKDAALMPGEVCSDECAALVVAVEKLKADSLSAPGLPESPAAGERGGFTDTQRFDCLIANPDLYFYPAGKDYVSLRTNDHDFMQDPEVCRGATHREALDAYLLQGFTGRTTPRTIQSRG